MRPRALLLVPLVVGALSLPALRNGLCWDDLEFTFAGGGRLLSAGLTGDLLAEANPGHGPSGYYRPAAVATLALTERLRPGPAAHHAVSVALHTLAAALLALLLRRRLQAALPAAAAALLWALHPANLEPVAWISGRYDLLTGLAAVAVLLVPRGPGAWRAGLLGLLLLVGLLSKEGFLAVAAVVVVDDLAAGERLATAWPRWVAVALALGLWLGLRLAFAIPAVALPPPADLPRDLLAGLATYLWRALAPWPPTVSHPYSPTWALAAAGAVALSGLLLLAWRRRALATPVALLLLPLLPMALAAARLGEAPERYLYLPSLGLAWLAGAGLAALAGRGALIRGAASLAVALLLVACATGWWLRQADWRDDAALFGAALRVDPGDPLGHLALGALALRAGRLDEAGHRFSEALERDPGSVRALSSLALVHLRRGEAAAALARARQAVALAPSYPQARLQLSGALHLSGDHAGELKAASAALALSPAFRQARITRALAGCELRPEPACEGDLETMARQGWLTPTEALVAGCEAAIRRRDPAAATERVKRLAAAAPADPRLPILAAAAARLAASAGTVQPKR